MIDSKPEVATTKKCFSAKIHNTTGADEEKEEVPDYYYDDELELY